MGLRLHTVWSLPVSWPFLSCLISLLQGPNTTVIISIIRQPPELSHLLLPLVIKTSQQNRTPDHHRTTSRIHNLVTRSTNLKHHRPALLTTILISHTTSTSHRTTCARPPVCIRPTPTPQPHLHATIISSATINHPPPPHHQTEETQRSNHQQIEKNPCRTPSSTAASMKKEKPSPNAKQAQPQLLHTQTDSPLSNPTSEKRKNKIKTPFSLATDARRIRTPTTGITSPLHC